MKKEVFLALVDAIVQERIDTIPRPKTVRGRAGRDFNLEDHKEEISEILNSFFQLEKEGFKLKFSELTTEEKHELSLKFEDLTLQQLSDIKGPKGKDGKDGEDGKDGRSFDFSENSEEIGDKITNYIDSLDLSFKFKDLKPEELSTLKLKFPDLTEEEKQELKGERGPRGQRGKQGDEGPKGEDGKDGLNGQDGEKGKDGEQGIQGDRGERGPRGQRGKQGDEGPRGIPGVPGPIGLKGDTGLNGINGQDGKDAPVVVDVELRMVSQNEMRFIFEFSDGSVINTNTVSLPSLKQTLYSFMASSGGGGGLSDIEVTDGTTTVNSGTIEFIGATVDDNGGNARVTVDQQLTSVTDGTTTLDTNNIFFDGATISDNGGGQIKVAINSVGDCLTIADEGNNVTSCAKAINFVGSTVQAYNSTVITDWPTLDVIDSMASWEASPGGLVTVEVKPQATSLQKVYKAGETISALQIVRLDASQLVFKSSNNGAYTDSKSVGISLTSATAGNDVSILMFGILEDNSFSFTPLEPLFLGVNGAITDTPPTPPINNFSVTIGQGIGLGAVFINIQEPIGL